MNNSKLSMMLGMAAMFGAMENSMNNPWYGKGRPNHKTKSKTAHKRLAEKKARKVQRRK